MAASAVLMSTANDKFEKLFTLILFASKSFCQRTVERKPPKEIMVDQKYPEKKS